MIKTEIILFVLICFFSSILFAQKVNCEYCKKNINGKYIIVDNKAYHLDHFKCFNCNKPIKGSYSTKNGVYYDRKCYEELFSIKCQICNKPINGEYLVDFYGKKYHKYHETELKKCDNCNRLISQKTTSGSKKYSDGRIICNICNEKVYAFADEYYRLLDKVILRLNNYGLEFRKPTIELIIVDLIELQKVSGYRYSKSIKGYTKTEMKVIGSKKSFKHFVYVLGNVPPKYVAATLAHELMHIWINENVQHKLSHQFEEGSCNFISYIYLKSDYSNDAKSIIKQLLNNPDKIYGDGFRKVYNRFKGRDFNLFLYYIKNNKTI